MGRGKRVRACNVYGSSGFVLAIKISMRILKNGFKIGMRMREFLGEEPFFRGA
jgi:hypothetical protein